MSDNTSKELREALPSAYNLISANRSIGYTLPSAIADIIDNSISADASAVEIISPPAPYPILKIVDNGRGMNLQELDEAMKFGGNRDCFAKRSELDLGRFGMGLKTATLSQCKCLEVVSKKNGEILGGCWDLDYLKDNDTWRYQVISKNKCIELIKGTMLAENNNGTVVVWSKFDRLSDKSSGGRNAVFAYQLDQATKKLELIFHRFLSGEAGIQNLTITYNGHQLKPNDPFLSSRNPDYSKPKTIPLEDDYITIYPHKLPHPKQLLKDELERLTLGSTLLETQGFYVYRAKRLIDYGTWFSLAPKLDKTKLTRIQIDIPNSLDHVWSLDIKKSRTILPQCIRDELRSIVETSTENSVNTFFRKGRIRKESYPVWIPIKKDKTVRYTINSEHPLFIGFEQTLTEAQQDQFKTILSFISSSLVGIINQIQLDQQNDFQPIVDENKEAHQKILHSQVKTLVDMGYDNELILQCFNTPEVKGLLDLIRGEHD